MKIVKILFASIGILLGTIVLGVGLFYGYLRMQDGPVEFYPSFTISIGGPFKTGELTPSPENWDFIKEREEIEFQTLSPTTSRTIWVPVVDGKLYIVSGYMNSTIGKIWKQWPARIEDDNRIILRIDGKLYEQRLERIMGGPIVAEVMAQVGRKYLGGDGTVIPESEAAVTSGSAWMFEVIDR